MPLLYVAGPVFGRDYFSEREPHFIYKNIIEICRAQNWDAQIPELDEELDRLPPSQFVFEITRRISKANAAVTLLTAGDQSVPVEATLTVAVRIPQVIALHQIKEAPRMLIGLPNVTSVVDADSSEKLSTAISKLIRSK